MQKGILRVIALVLVTALVADPTTLHAMALQPIQFYSPPQIAAQAHFEHEALISPVVWVGKLISNAMPGTKKQTVKVKSIQLAKQTISKQGAEKNAFQEWDPILQEGLNLIVQHGEILKWDPVINPTGGRDWTLLRITFNRAPKTDGHAEIRLNFKRGNPTNLYEVGFFKPGEEQALKTASDRDSFLKNTQETLDAALLYLQSLTVPADDNRDQTRSQLTSAVNLYLAHYDQGQEPDEDDKSTLRDKLPLIILVAATGLALTRLVILPHVLAASTGAETHFISTIHWVSLLSWGGRSIAGIILGALIGGMGAEALKLHQIIQEIDPDDSHADLSVERYGLSSDLFYGSIVIAVSLVFLVFYPLQIFSILPAALIFFLGLLEKKLSSADSTTRTSAAPPMVKPIREVILDVMSQRESDRPDHFLWRGENHSARLDQKLRLILLGDLGSTLVVNPRMDDQGVHANWLVRVTLIGEKNIITKEVLLKPNDMPLSPFAVSKQSSGASIIGSFPEILKSLGNQWTVTAELIPPDEAIERRSPSVALPAAPTQDSLNITDADLIQEIGMDRIKADPGIGGILGIATFEKLEQGYIIWAMDAGAAQSLVGEAGAYRDHRKLNQVYVTTKLQSSGLYAVRVIDFSPDRRTFTAEVLPEKEMVRILGLKAPFRSNQLPMYGHSQIVSLSEQQTRGTAEQYVSEDITTSRSSLPGGFKYPAGQSEYTTDQPAQPLPLHIQILDSLADRIPKYTDRWVTSGELYTHFRTREVSQWKFCAALWRLEWEKYIKVSISIPLAIEITQLGREALKNAKKTSGLRTEQDSGTSWRNALVIVAFAAVGSTFGRIVASLLASHTTAQQAGALVNPTIFPDPSAAAGILLLLLFVGVFWAHITGAKNVPGQRSNAKEKGERDVQAAA